MFVMHLTFLILLLVAGAVRAVNHTLPTKHQGKPRRRGVHAPSVLRSLGDLGDLRPASGGWGWLSRVQSTFKVGLTSGQVPGAGRRRG